MLKKLKKWSKWGKKMKKKTLFVILILVPVLLTGCYSKNNNKYSLAKTFDKGNFKITLTDEFEEENTEYATYFFASNNIYVNVTETNFKDLDFQEDIDLEDFIDFLKSINSAELKVEKYNNLYYYETEKVRENYHFFVIYAVTKNSNSLWEIDMETNYKNKDLLKNKLIEYVKTIEVKD